MNNIKEDKTANNRNVKYNRFKLIKKIDNKGSTLPFLNGSCNNLPTVYSKNSNHNHNQSSRINNSTYIDNNNNIINGKGTISISSYMNKNIRNNHKKYISSFYVDDEMSMNMNKSSMNKSMRLGDRSKNQKEDRTNPNNKKEEYKRAYSKKRTEKEIQNKINKMNKASFGKVNKYEKKSKNYINNSKRMKQNNNNNNDLVNKKEHNNRFNRVKTVGHLRKSNVDEMNITKEKINKEESSKHQNKHMNDKDKKNYTNLYDKYLNKFKDKISKNQNNKNYKDEIENKTKETQRNKNLNLNINKKHNFRKNLTCVMLEKRNNNKSTYRKNRDYSRGEILKEKTDKRDYRISGKSIDNRNYNRSKNKRKATVVVHHGSKKESEVKNKVRSKSVVKLADRKNLIKKDIEDEYDIETILYGEIKPSKDEDPFDDVDSVVKKIDFDSVNLNTKNIFIDKNEKYKIYSNNFDNFFDKLVKNKNIDKKEKNTGSNSISENTSDSSKKIK